MLFLLLAACSDYDINEKPQDVDPGTTAPPGPDIVVDPAAVDLGVVCELGETVVTVGNAGQADLLVRALTVDGGWTLGENPAPFTVAPGAEQPISLVGFGDGTLTVVSDDPDEPEVAVPLYVAGNGAPTVVWANPPAGSVLPVSGITALEATVTDDADPLDTLSVSWTSDVDGALGVDVADGAGFATIPWNATDHSAGNHTLTVDVTDSCGVTTSTSVAVCQDLGYDVDTLDLATWHFEGSAVWDNPNSWVQLTSAAADQAGTAFQTVSTVSADDVTIDFLFFASGGSGADGLSLTALDADRMTGFVGSTGGGIGYQGLPGWTIEVDTWYNAEYSDPTQLDHISFHLDGSYTVLAWAPLPEMEDGNWHAMSVVVSGVHVTAAIDGVTYLDFDAPRSLSFPAYVGFTAATGSYTNYHLIDALVVTESVCEGG